VSPAIDTLGWLVVGAVIVVGLALAIVSIVAWLGGA